MKTALLLVVCVAVLAHNCCNAFLTVFRALRLSRPNEFEIEVRCKTTLLAKKKKGPRRIITLECTEAKGERKPPSRYITQKNVRNVPERLELMKYNPHLKRRTLHREIK
mmetsp:Transcript_49092/g.96807  ORF Transcript_49092/g.96807 Transcript_49092/m.96807 type:complete len:109 (-) Transcript_49092:398-724(-)